MIARLLISNSTNLIKEELKKLLKSYLEQATQHPDLLYFPSDAKLGIEQARDIKAHFSLKPYSAKGRVAVLEDASKLTIEAQNALLKTLEELPIKSALLLGADSDSHFLPTILSRCEITHLSIDHTTSIDSENVKNIKNLLNSTLEERFSYIEKLKDKEQFLNSLIEYFHQHLSNFSDFLKELLKAEEWAKQNVNMRAILEYLMLVMPQK